jgi:hypothetical protein
MRNVTLHPTHHHPAVRTHSPWHDSLLRPSDPFMSFTHSHNDVDHTIHEPHANDIHRTTKPAANPTPLRTLFTCIQVLYNHCTL